MRYLKAAGTVTIWTLQVLASLGFVYIGIAKFRPGFWIAGFARWGYSDSFRMLIGVLEVAGGALLAFPPTASYAAAVLGCILAGAIGTLVLHNEHPFPPLVWIAVTALIGLVRLPRMWRPGPRGVPATLDTV